MAEDWETCAEPNENVGRFMLTEEQKAAVIASVMEHKRGGQDGTG